MGGAPFLARPLRFFFEETPVPWRFLYLMTTAIKRASPSMAYMAWGRAES